MNINNKKGISSPKVLLLIVILWVVHLGGFSFDTLADKSIILKNKVTELLRGIEAWNDIRYLRFSVETCMNASNGKYDNCFNEYILNEFNNRKGSHFYYKWDFFGGDDYVIAAGRNTLDGGNTKNKIFMLQQNNIITRKGEGLYSFIW